MTNIEIVRILYVWKKNGHFYLLMKLTVFFTEITIFSIDIFRSFLRFLVSNLESNIEIVQISYIWKKNGHLYILMKLTDFFKEITIFSVDIFRSFLCFLVPSLVSNIEIVRILYI